MEPRTHMPVTVIGVDQSALKNLSLSILMTIISRVEALTRSEEMPCMVVSSLEGVDERFTRVYDLARNNDLPGAVQEFESIFTYHEDVVNGLVPKAAKFAFAKAFEAENRLVFELIQRISRKSPLAEPASDDAEEVKAALLAVGPRLAALVIKTGLIHQGFLVRSAAASDLIATTTAMGTRRHTDPLILLEESRENVREWYAETSGQFSAGAVVSEMRGSKKDVGLIEGGVGAALGTIMTLGQQGADRSAVLIARAFAGEGEPEVYLLKDINPTELSVSWDWHDLRTWQSESGRHPVGDSAIGEAIDGNVFGRVVDVKTGKECFFIGSSQG